MIQIHQPEIEALIYQRLKSGRFENIEDVLLQALTDAPLPSKPNAAESTGTGADLIAALQRSPFNGLDIDFESARKPMPVREVEL